MWVSNTRLEVKYLPGQTTHGVCPPNIAGILYSTRDPVQCSILMHTFHGLYEANETGILGCEHSLLFLDTSLSSYIKDLINYLFTNNSEK